MAFGALWLGWMGWSRLRGTGFARVPRGAAVGLLGGAAVIAVSSAFVPRLLFGPTPQATATGPRIASTATLAIERPGDGWEANGSEMTVAMDLEGGTVIEQTSTSVTPDTGHIHLTIDGAIVSMTYGTQQVVGLDKLTPGPHELVAEYVAADHLPFEPRVTDTVTFEVPS